MPDAVKITRDPLHLSQQEKAVLSGWSFTNSYLEFQEELIDLAQGAYRIACIHFRPQRPTPYQCYEQLWFVLTQVNFYKKDIAQKKLEKSELYTHGAQLLAKYVLSQDWKTIEKTRCP